MAIHHAHSASLTPSQTHRQAVTAYTEGLSGLYDRLEVIRKTLSAFVKDDGLCALSKANQERLETINNTLRHIDTIADGLMVRVFGASYAASRRDEHHRGQ